MSVQGVDGKRWNRGAELLTIASNTITSFSWSSSYLVFCPLAPVSFPVGLSPGKLFLLSLFFWAGPAFFWPAGVFQAMARVSVARAQ